MTQNTKKNSRSAALNKKNPCKVSTNVKAGWKWLDDLKTKINNNLPKT
ncbi:MAG: hypothetical protein WBM35_17260 [Candidatus Electrothrix sp.]